MDLETLRNHLLKKPGANEGLPFGPQALVFKVLDKMFAVIALDAFPSWVTLKCDPERALLLREQYEAVRPGYHTNKKHWNTVTLDGSVPDAELLEWVDHSYQLVVQGMSKTARDRLKDSRRDDILNPSPPKPPPRRPDP